MVLCGVAGTVICGGACGIVCLWTNRERGWSSAAKIKRMKVLCTSWMRVLMQAARRVPLVVPVACAACL
jgi:hypothetical protein